MILVLNDSEFLMLDQITKVKRKQVDTDRWAPYWIVFYTHTKVTEVLKFHNESARNNIYEQILTKYSKKIFLEER